MGATKYEFYPDDLISSAELFKAIGHPARLKALLMIANGSDHDTTVDDIVQEIGLARSTLSVHLKKLSDSGLIRSTVTSKSDRSFLCYRLNKPAFDHLIHFLNNLYTKLNNKEVDNVESSKWSYTRLKSTLQWSSFYVT